jgi:hypothetical protein
LGNPITCIHENVPPILIQHGRLVSQAPVQQSILFVEKLEKYVAPDRFELDILEGAGHGDPLFETDENMEKVFAFLDKHSRKELVWLGAGIQCIGSPRRLLAPIVENMWVKG